MSEVYSYHRHFVIKLPTITSWDQSEQLVVGLRFDLKSFEVMLDETSERVSVC